MDVTIPVQVVVYVALVVGFCLFLWKSNLVPDTEGGFNPKEQLTRGHVWWSHELTLVDVVWSKNNQYRKRELTLPLITARNKQVCPVFWVNYLLQLFPQFSNSPNDPLFTYPKGGKLVPLTYDVLAAKLKDWVAQTGRSAEGFTLHGLHRGGANHALTAGVIAEDVKLLGDWVSMAYLEYLDLSMERRITNMVKFMDHVDVRLQTKHE